MYKNELICPKCFIDHCKHCKCNKCEVIELEKYCDYCHKKIGNSGEVYIAGSICRGHTLSLIEYIKYKFTLWLINFGTKFIHLLVVNTI